MGKRKPEAEPESESDVEFEDDDLRREMEMDADAGGGGDGGDDDDALEDEDDELEAEMAALESSRRERGYKKLENRAFVNNKEGLRASLDGTRAPHRARARRLPSSSRARGVRPGGSTDRPRRRTIRFSPDERNESLPSLVVALSRAPRPRLASASADFQWTKKAKWIDHMVVAGTKTAETLADVNDDLARETHFYEHALRSAEVAIKNLKEIGVAVKRPDDFYAEMVKSDEHMKRVRAELIFEQTSQETREERRKAREQKRYGKQVQAEKIKERTLKKKESIKNLDKWRKQRKQNGFADDGKAPDGFEDAPRQKERGGSRGGGGQHGRSTPESQKKREFKNEKFGFGGRKRVRRRRRRRANGRTSAVFFSFRFVTFATFPARIDSKLETRNSIDHRRAQGVLPASLEAWRKGHLLLYGVYPALKRLKVPPAVVGSLDPWRAFARAHIERASRHAPRIFHCLGERRRRHYASGQTMLVLFDPTRFRRRLLETRNARAALRPDVLSSSPSPSLRR